MSTSQSVVVWGELLWDRFPDGARLGGAPANLAWHVGQAGGWAQLISRVGDDADGHRALAQLGEVVDTSLVQLDPERATGEVEITLERGEPRYRLVPGRAWERIECTADARAAIGDAGVFVYGTLAQRTPAGLASWRDAIAATRATTADAGDLCLRVLDVNLRPADRDTPETRAAITLGLAAADVVKVNDHELALLGAWHGWADPLAMLRAPDDRAPRVVAVTRGADGSTLYGPDGAIAIPATPARAGGDSVGCGDAYLAILVHGLTLGWDLEACGRAASRWAAAVAGVRGGTPAFTDEQIEELLDPS